MRSISFFERHPCRCHVGDHYAVQLASDLVGGRHAENTIGIDFDGDPNLTPESLGVDSGKFKSTKQVIVLGASSFILIDLNEDTGLVVKVHREDFGFFGWYCRVALDENSHDTTSSLNTQGQRCNIKKKQVLRFL